MMPLRGFKGVNDYTGAITQWEVFVPFEANPHEFIKRCRASNTISLVSSTSVIHNVPISKTDLENVVFPGEGNSASRIICGKLSRSDSFFVLAVYPPLDDSGGLNVGKSLEEGNSCVNVKPSEITTSSPVINEFAQTKRINSETTHVDSPNFFLSSNTGDDSKGMTQIRQDETSVNISHTGGDFESSIDITSEGLKIVHGETEIQIKENKVSIKNSGSSLLLLLEEIQKVIDGLKMVDQAPIMVPGMPPVVIPPMLLMLSPDQASKSAISGLMSKFKELLF